MQEQDHKYFITVVTICFNGSKYLEGAIQSVVNQSLDSVEYIVIDGGSKDGSIDIIKNYESKITRWISEPDNGIADAMNKAISMSSGEYILFVHADDYLISPSILSKVAACIDRTMPICIFNLQKSENGHMKEYKPRGFNLWMNFKTGIFHQGCICKKSLFNDIGDFNTYFKIAMDYDFFLRAYRKNIKYAYHDFPICVMRDTGISSRLDKESQLNRFSEEKRVHKIHCNSFFLKIIYKIYWPIYLAYRSMKYTD